MKINTDAIVLSGYRACEIESKFVLPDGKIMLVCKPIKSIESKNMFIKTEYGILLSGNGVSVFGNCVDDACCKYTAAVAAKQSQMQNSQNQYGL